MIRKIKSYFTNDSLIIQIIATLIASLIIWAITVSFGVIKGFDFYSSIEWTLKILNVKINFIWYLITILIFGLLLFRLKKALIKQFTELTYSKEQIDRKNDFQNQKIDRKLDISRFERFSDVYDYRRLKNHPFHQLYTLNDIDSFLTILKEGNRTSDIYKVENAMEGLILEIKEQESIHSSVKNEIKEEIKNCFTDKFIHHKDELDKVLDEIRIY